MQQNAKKIIFFIIGLIAYSAISLLIPVTHGKTFWITFGISVFELCISFIVCYLCIHKKDTRVPLFEITITRYSMIYSGIQLVFNFVVMILGIVQLWIILLTNVIFIAFYLIVLLFATYTKNYESVYEKQNKDSVRNFKSIKISIETLDGKVQDYELKQAMHKLGEVIQYSDPVSSQELLIIEEKIIKHVELLENLIETEKVEEAISTCNKLIDIVDERNRMCKLYK